MRPRFLLLVSAPEALADLVAEAARATGLTPAGQAGPVAALVNAGCACLPADGQGLVLGTLFHRNGPARALNKFLPAAQARLAVGGRAVLLRDYWGGYVAAFRNETATEILRDPSGALPCYWARKGGAALLASDAELLRAAGAVSARFDWPALGRFLYAGGLPTPETAIEGVHELLPGFALQAGDGEPAAEPWWSPWDFASSEPDENIVATAERLRRTVHACAAAWSSRASKPLMSLSGGLDSSIVAACVAATGADAACLTMFADDPANDERGFARLLCERVGLPLVERAYTFDAIDIDAPLGFHLPRPVGRTQDQAYERAHIDVAVGQGHDAFITGNGGDNVFGYSQSAAPIADRLLHDGFSAGTMRALRDVCRQTGSGPLRAARAALRLARGPRAYRWRPNPSLLHPDLVAANAATPLTHPWLAAPAGALPGKAAHIAALLRVQQSLEPGRGRHAPVVHPLLSQPIVEACLAIPSWQWRLDGRDRALARRAFAADLPAAIIERRTKGAPDQFCTGIVRHYRDGIRARLLDGRLAGQGMVDRVAIERMLLPEREPSGMETVRLLELVNVEAWLNAWSGSSETGPAMRPAAHPGAALPNV